MSNHKKQRNPDHVRRTNQPAPSNEAIEEQLKALLTPVVFAQASYYRSLGLRERILGLPVMVAAVLMMLWRQVPSVCELAKLLSREDLLFTGRTTTGRAKVSQQALSQRFLDFPAEIFKHILVDLLPLLQQRWALRKRPLPASVVCASKTFSRILTVDCSVLEAIFRKLDSLQEVPAGKLAGKICMVVDVFTRLPEYLWFSEDAKGSDMNFLPEILGFAQAGMLLLFDRGFREYSFYDSLIDKGAAFISRPRSNDSCRIEKVLFRNDHIRDQIVRMGSPDSEYGRCRHLMRRVDVLFRGKWYSYLTSVLDPTILPADVVADLYRRRWRIEEAFLVVKRLLNLAYLWTGSENGVLLQLWATWLFFAVLVDIGDAVAEELMLPFDQISLEMVFRSFYHFTQAYSKGKATDIVKYLADPANRDLGVVKRHRKRPPPKQNSSAPKPNIPAEDTYRELSDCELAYLTTPLEP